MRRQRKTTPDVADELTRVAGATQAPKLGQRLAEATRAYERERYPEARSMLKTLADRAPGSAAVRELYGLTLYRLGQWKLAQRELEAFVTLTGSTEQHPVLADCARALGQRQRVNELWEELRAASPSAELVTEGRIVAAGSLADEGKLREGIELLEQGWKAPKKPEGAPPPAALRAGRPARAGRRDPLSPGAVPALLRRRPRLRRRRRSPQVALARAGGAQRHTPSLSWGLFPPTIEVEMRRRR